MNYKTERFNAGFGICFKCPKSSDDFPYCHSRRRDNNLTKLIASIPIFSLVIGIGRLLRTDEEKRAYRCEIGESMVTLRALLYGSIVGIPVGVALDLVGMVTQVKYAIKCRPKHNLNMQLKLDQNLISLLNNLG